MHCTKYFVVYELFVHLICQAVPDTKLTLKKYTDAKVEFLVSYCILSN